MNNIVFREKCINIEEIESVLRNHAAIAEAVISVDKGKYSERLIAWIICKPIAETDIPEIQLYLKKFLPNFMIPSVFIFTKQFPMDTNGKIDRVALSFDAAKFIFDNDCEGPQNQVERVVADIWRIILRQERIGIHDDFLDLGGDSVQAGLISLKIHEYFKIKIPLVMFFENMNVRLITTLIENNIDTNVYEQSNRIPSIERNDYLPLSFFQEERLKYELILDVNNIQYLHASSWFSIKLSGDLDYESLKKAFNHVINRHEVFRTAYLPVLDSVSPGTDKWNTICQTCSINPRLFLPKVKFKQFVHSAVNMNFNYYDISEYCDEDKNIEVNIIYNGILQQRYMYESPPLTRAVLIRIAKSEHILLVAAAHLIADGVSMGIYEKELAHIYNALANNRPIDIPEIDIQYADYVAWMLQRLKTGSLDSVKSYWQNQFNGYTLTDVTILPFIDIEGCENDIDFSIDAKYYYHPISEGLNVEIQKYSSSVNMTVFSIVMAGFILCLYKESGKNDIGVYTFFANRTRPETENIIGMFATGNIIRIKIDENDSFNKCAASVSESLKNAIMNQEFMIVPPISRVIKSLFDLVVSRPITCELLIDNECSLFSNLNVEKVVSGRNKSEHALKLFVFESDNKLALMFQYNLDLFDITDIRRMGERTENILKEIIKNPSATISSLVF